MIPVTGLGRHLLALGTLALVGACAQSGRDAASTVEAEHVAHLLGYLDADYARFGASEQAEHLAVAAEAARLAQGVRGFQGLPERIAEVSALVKSLAPVNEVHQHVASLRSGLLALARVAQVPDAAPSLAHGRALYEQSCAVCHGITGHADTAAAVNLRPHPANFSEPAFGATLSPYDVTTAVRFGVDGTAMLPFPSLDETDRWDLAFYVAGLRHPGTMADDVPSAELALANDNELGEQLFAAGISGARLPPTVNALRRRVPFEAETQEPISVARRKLDAARVATVRGDRTSVLEAIDAAEASVASVVGRALSAADPELLSKLHDTFTGLAERVRSPASVDVVTENIGTALQLLTYIERVTGVRGRGRPSPPPETETGWPTEIAASARATTSPSSETSARAACTDPGFGPGPDLRPLDDGLAFEVTHNCMFPGNDQLEIVVRLTKSDVPKRAQVDGLLRGLLVQVQSGTAGRMPELTHINAFSADGKNHYGRLELDGDEGPQGEMEIYLDAPFDADEWSRAFAASHSAGFVGASKPEVSVDHEKQEITVTYPFIDPGSERWSERVTATRAYIEAFPWFFDFYPPRTDVQAMSFIGVRKGKPVFTVHIKDLQTFLAMDPWPIRERMAAAGIPIEPTVRRTPAQDAVLGSEYAHALARLPKGSVVIDRSPGMN